MIKSILRKTVCALMAAGACAGANATTTHLGLVGTSAPTPFSGSVLAAGPFTDVFTFTLPVNLGSGYSVVNFPLTIPGLGSFNTVLTSMSLISNPDGVLFNADDAFVTGTVSGGASSLSMSWGPTAGGHMYLNIGGITNGTIGGLYSGAISVTPIPEPGTYAMFLAGLGMIGLIARRRLTGK